MLTSYEGAEVLVLVRTLLAKIGMIDFTLALLKCKTCIFKT